jgi:hypothetical protein
MIRRTSPDPTGDKWRYWQSVRIGPLALVLAAVGFTFAVIGFVQDLADPSGPFVRVAGIAAFTGAISALAFAIIARRRRWLPLAIAIVGGGPFLIGLLPAVHPLAPLDSFPAVQRRLTADGFAILCSVMAGYGFFIVFIATEGRRHLRTETEIALSRVLQHRLVPPICLSTNHLEAYGRSDPSTEVGGDLVDVVELKDGLLAYVADVTGHGIPAGVLMGMVKSIVRAELRTSQSPGALLSVLNAVLPDLKEPNVFVTAAMLRVNAGNVVDYALAGHPPILWYRRRLDAVTFLSTAQPLLGLVPSAYEDAQVVAEPGDLLAVVSDGLLEVFDRHDGDFEVDRLAALIRERAGSALPDVFDAVFQAVRQHGPQLDDQTLLLVRVQGMRDDVR